MATALLERLFAELLVERDAVDAEERGGAGAVAARRLERGLDRELFEGVEPHRQPHERGIGRFGRRGAAGDVLRQIGGLDDGAVAEDERVLDRVAELADVAGPRVLLDGG